MNKEQLEKRLKEIEQALMQALANYNACEGAKQEVRNLISIVEKEETVMIEAQKVLESAKTLYQEESEESEESQDPKDPLEVMNKIKPVKVTTKKSKLKSNKQDNECVYPDTTDEYFPESIL